MKTSKKLAILGVVLGVGGFACMGFGYNAVALAGLACSLGTFATSFIFLLGRR